MERMYGSDLVIIRTQLRISRRYITSALLVMNHIQLR
jgi:hypothetical protein